MPKISSLQDLNLSSRPITVSAAVVNSDIDCTFAKKPSGDIYQKKDAQAVIQSVKNLLMTNHGSRPFRPLLGADLGSLLFELDTDLNKRDIKTLVESTISNYEPRAIVNQVIVNIKPDYNSVDVLVKFNVVDFDQEVSVNVNIARIR